METPPQIIHQPRSFFSTLAIGVSALLVTGVVGFTVIVLYGMNIADRKSEDLIEGVEAVVQDLPELQKALPPVLADLLHDERRPDYGEQLEITAKLVRSPSREGYRPVVTIENKGTEMVTLLSMRVVALNADNDPIEEWNEWGATPFAAEPEWRGPLMPGSIRSLKTWHVVSHRGILLDEMRVQVEVTDIRVWKSNNAPTYRRQI